MIAVGWRRVLGPVGAPLVGAQGRAHTRPAPTTRVWIGTIGRPGCGSYVGTRGDGRVAFALECRSREARSSCCQKPAPSGNRRPHKPASAPAPSLLHRVAPASPFLAVVERCNQGIVIAPMGFHADKKLKENFWWENLFQFLPRFGADLFDSASTRADHDGLL